MTLVSSIMICSILCSSSSSFQLLDLFDSHSTIEDCSLSIPERSIFLERIAFFIRLNCIQRSRFFFQRRSFSKVFFLQLAHSLKLILDSAGGAFRTVRFLSSFCCLYFSIFITNFLQMQREYYFVSPSLSRRSIEMRLLLFLSIRASSLTPQSLISLRLKFKHLIQESALRQLVSQNTALSLILLFQRLISTSPELEMSSAGISPLILKKNTTQLRLRECQDSTEPIIPPISQRLLCEKSTVMSDLFQASAFLIWSTCSSVSPQETIDNYLREVAMMRPQLNYFMALTESIIFQIRSIFREELDSMERLKQCTKSLNLGVSAYVLICKTWGSLLLLLLSEFFSLFSGLIIIIFWRGRWVVISWKAGKSSGTNWVISREN